MNNPNELKNKLLSMMSGGISGIISCVIVLIGDFTSIILFPGGFSFIENMVSDLGTGPYGFIFNFGLIFSGIVSVPYYLALVRSFDNEQIKENLKKFTITFSMISVITFIFVGVFPSIEENYIIYFTHGTFAFISLLTGAVYLILFSIMMLKDQQYKKIQAYHGFIVSGTYIMFLFTWIPITEWIATFAIITWIIANSFFMISKN